MPKTLMLLSSRYIPVIGYYRIQEAPNPFLQGNWGDSCGGCSFCWTGTIRYPAVFPGLMPGLAKPKKRVILVSSV